MELNKIYNEDCLLGMKRIPDKSVDMILCDLPYGTTSNKWDTIIPFEPLWEQTVLDQVDSKRIEFEAVKNKGGESHPDILDKVKEVLGR